MVDIVCRARDFIGECPMLHDVNLGGWACSIWREWLWACGVRIVRDERVTKCNDVRRTAPTFSDRVFRRSRYITWKTAYTFRISMAKTVNRLIVISDDE